MMQPRDITLSTGKIIGTNYPCFVIAEVGQNHQGDLEIAKQLILSAKESGADCVKFQKSNLQEKFTKQALDAPYTSKNSWGKTYGEHKKYLEFSDEEFLKLKQYANEIRILFTASAMDSASFDFLASLDVPFIKIGSGDADNLILIEKAASAMIPLIISTGMQSMKNVEKIYNTVKKHHLKFSLLHCISAYPTPPNEANLRVISTYKDRFQDIHIGYSGHETNYNLTLAAVALGAKVVERHLTLNNKWKGSDHSCSLNPQSFKQMVESIREIECALGNGIKAIQACELECYSKLGKCLVAAKFLQKGHKIEKADIKVKVARKKGLSPLVIYEVIGNILKCDLEEDQIITEEDITINKN